MKLKQLCSLAGDYGLNISADEYVEVDGVPLIRTSDFNDLGQLDLSNAKCVSATAARDKLLKKGDMLFSRAGTIGRCMVVEGDDPVTFAAYLVRYRPKPDCVSTGYLKYWAQSSQFWSQVRANVIESTIGNFNASKLSALEVPDIDLQAQQQIADFLDRETARIDLLIGTKRSLLDVITRKEVLLRDDAVLRGLRGAKLKASGVEWFGEVPESWTVCRFNRLIASKVDYRGRTPEKVDDGVFLVTARNIRNGRIDYERSQEYTTQADWDALSARGRPALGDVIFTTEAPLGQVAQVDRTDVAFAQRIMKFRANTTLATNDYLAELLMTSSFQRSLQLYASGSTAAGIKSERLAHLFGLAPPIEEQNEIVHSVRSGVAALRELSRPITTSIDRLREYRSALITAAVTGEIDVSTYNRRGATDRILDQIEEEMTA